MAPNENAGPLEGTGEVATGQGRDSILTPTADTRGRPPRNQPVRPSRRSTPSDSPEAVAQVVASILDGPPLEEERGLPRSLQEIARIRSAARRVLEAKLSPADEDRLLGAIARRATRAELHEWAEEALLVEIAGPQIEVIDHSVTTAHTRLRTAKLEACPICLSRVFTQYELEDRRRREKWAAEGLARWEGLTR